MVKDPGDYRWSSFRTHALGIKARLWTPHGLYLGLGRSKEQRQEAWRGLVNESLDMETVAKVRHCANTGLVLGTESFRQQVSRLRN